ncbi:hypothetical protein IC620_11255 [Hazenella sp. IB182357]|uniref:Uncharacterized protein n=1 Tax=Polycladospora coralii TaxID=2771432 RepID=A0A926N6H9_9BACL|nr:hypothetical protein [Polycladospora coralii]MBD1372934.1 hypothetical protein [Polycladospora coralii]MBS7531009.1 hypothetical protein [Polycladospora coralii]
MPHPPKLLALETIPVSELPLGQQCSECCVECLDISLCHCPGPIFCPFSITQCLTCTTTDAVTTVMNASTKIVRTPTGQINLSYKKSTHPILQKITIKTQKTPVVMIRTFKVPHSFKKKETLVILKEKNGRKQRIFIDHFH